jgi:peptide/nickel transport system substrate-binding protein
MKKSVRFVVLAAVMVLLAGLLVPVLAQDAKPGEGGILIEGNFGGDPASFNSLLASDTASARVAGFLIPAFVGIDPATALFRENDPSALVKSWTISEDELTYTFTLRDDMKWSDGTPITSADYMYSWEAIKSGLTETALNYQPTDIIESIEAPDATTVVVTFKAAACTNLAEANYIPSLPSHILPTDFAELNTADYNTNPSVSGGVFSFSAFSPSEQVALVANQSYGGAANGVLPSGWIYKVVPDQTVLVEQFIAGETNVIDGAGVNRRQELVDNADIQSYRFPGNAWDYLALNYADPTNPQNALDESGNPIDQGHHPLFGDPRVRQAIAAALDVDSIVQGAVFGFGTRMPSMAIPASWAFDKTLVPIAYDVSKAAAMLDEAGFVDDDGNLDTPRVAKGAMYAADGTPFTFVLYTNEGNSRRGAVGTLVQDQLKQVGIQVDFQAIDFNTLLDIMDGQSYDAFILGWRNGYPDDPDQTNLFTPSGDIVGSGNNTTSYNNPKVNELMEQARTVAGCDPAERAKIYAEIQKVMQEDLPYVPLYTIEGYYGATAAVNGFGPYPSQLYWNVDTWSVKATP